MVDEYPHIHLEISRLENSLEIVITNDWFFYDIKEY